MDGEKMIDVKKLLFELSALGTVTGREKAGAEKLQALVGSYYDECYFDRTGNAVFVKRCGKAGAKRILLDAHFDEIGFAVTGICDGGFLKICPVGGFDRGILPASEVLIYGKETLFGVIAATPAHLQKPGENKKNPKFEELIVDTGYERSELEKLVSVGTLVGFRSKCTELLDGRVCGGGFDDKACCAGITAAVAMSDRDKLAGDVYAVYSVREEIGGEGPSLAAFDIRPDVAFVCDVTFAQTPGTEKSQTVPYGKGPSVAISATCDRDLGKKIMRIAKEKEIPLSIEVVDTDRGTNAAALALAMEGVSCVNISIPIGNMHTYNEALEISDAEDFARLLGAVICDGSVFEKEEWA